MKGPAIALFVALGIVWGSNFIFVKWATAYLSPPQITLLRVAFGFLPVLLYALERKVLSWAHLRHAHHFLVMSLLATALYYYAFAEGTARLPSSIAGMLSGAIPLFTCLCTWLFLKNEPISRIKGLGVALGFLGVLLIARPWSADGELELGGVLYMMAGSLCVGGSFVYARRFLSPLKLSPVALTTYQIGLAMLLLSLTTDLDGAGRVFADTRAWLGLIVGLGMFGTGLAYIAYYHIVDTLGALAASSSTYLPPVVALLIGVTLAGEPISVMGCLAVTLILLGVATVQFGDRLLTAVCACQRNTR